MAQRGDVPCSGSQHVLDQGFLLSPPISGTHVPEHPPMLPLMCLPPPQKGRGVGGGGTSCPLDLDIRAGSCVPVWQGAWEREGDTGAWRASFLFCVPVRSEPQSEEQACLS